MLGIDIAKFGDLAINTKTIKKSIAQIIGSQQLDQEIDKFIGEEQFLVETLLKQPANLATDNLFYKIRTLYTS
jgi:hypothetical protein